ncbi:diguanylate cyclase, partial [Pararhizobium antarcticum]
MDEPWKVLAGNLATVALLISAWTHLSHRLYRLPTLWRNVGLGFTLGLAAIASMLLAVHFDIGVILDLRLPILLSASVFGGPVAAVITAFMASIFRIYLGGIGVESALITIAAVLALGCFLWLTYGKRPMDSEPSILAVSVLSGCLSLAELAILSQETFWRALREIGAPSVVLNLATTGVIGLYLAYFSRFTLERDILYAALTQAPDYHYVKDINHQFVAANLNVARHNGRAKSSEMLGLTDYDLAPKERAEQLIANERAVLQTGIALRWFEEFLAEEGKEPRWYSTSKVPLRNRQGDLIGLAGVTVDITARKLLEQELKSSQNTMAQAMAEMSDGLAMFGSDGRVIYCNEQYRQFFPKSAYARVVGSHISDIIRAAVRNGERQDLPVDLGEESIQTAAQSLFMDMDETIPMSDGRWLSLRTRVTEDRNVLALISDITAIKQSELSLKLLADHMKGLAETDALTGLPNRRSLDHALQREFELARRTTRPLSFLLIDVDRFKLFNDLNGHLAGDACLKAVASAISTAARRTGDLAARFGGEEFAIVLPDTDAEAAVRIAEKVKRAVRNLGLTHGASEYGVVTVSLGVTTLTASPEVDQPLDLVGCADLALY